jgi:hypothetical protein
MFSVAKIITASNERMMISEELSAQDLDGSDTVII